MKPPTTLTDVVCVIHDTITKLDDNGLLSVDADGLELKARLSASIQVLHRAKDGESPPDRRAGDLSTKDARHNTKRTWRGKSKAKPAEPIEVKDKKPVEVIQDVGADEPERGWYSIDDDQFPPRLPSRRMQ